MAGGLTPAQAAVYEAAVAYIDERGCSPTLAELADTLGVRTSTICTHLRWIAKRGFIRRRHGAHRSIEIVAERRTISLERAAAAIRALGVDSPHAITTLRMNGYTGLAAELVRQRARAV